MTAAPVNRLDLAPEPVGTSLNLMCPMTYDPAMDEQLATGIGERLASLSERQREVLRLVSRDRNSKEIGRELGLSDETVKNHIKAAIRRLGVSSRFDAARLLHLHEQGDPQVVIDPSRVIAIPVRPATNDRRGVGGSDAEVREATASFDFREHDFAEIPMAPRPAPERRGTGQSALRTVALIAVLTVAVAVAVISAAPLAKSVQDMANIIEPPNRHS